MTKINTHIYDFGSLKMRIEQIGLLLSLSGIAFILQPISLMIYTNGFYVLIIGAIIYFLGSTLPEEAMLHRALTQIISIIVIFIIIISLAIYLSPLLVV